VSITGKEEWDAVWQSVLKLNTDFPDLIYIGGVAVYLHMMNHATPGPLIEFSHDIDIYASLADFADMRDLYVVTANRRLNRHQTLFDCTAIDVYVEHGHRLAVPYADLAAYAVDYDGIRVASPEHLMILKIDAASDRWSSPKGEKDRRDVAKIGWLLGGKARKALLTPFLNEERQRLLADVGRSQAFMEVAEGNAHLATTLLSEYTRFLQATCATSRRHKPGL